MPDGHDSAAAPPPGPPCANCGTPVAERYCSRCGQDRGLTPHVPLRELLGEVVGEVLSLDGRVLRTLVPFLVRPGFLTAEYLAGRRVRYSSPLRLYLLATVLFFLALAVHPSRGPLFKVEPGDAERLAGEVRFRPPATLEEALGDGGAARPPAGGPPAAGGAPAAGTPHVPTEAERAELRRTLEASAAHQAAPVRWLMGRAAALAELPPEEAARRFGQELLQQAPRVLFLLVPVMAALLALLFRGARRYYAEHLVFALHVQALGFALATPGVLLDLDPLLGLGSAATAAHLLLALRRVYGRPWGATLWRFAVLGALYLLTLALGVAAAALLALALV